MNWRLILFLSALGPMTAILIGQEFAHAWETNGFNLVLSLLIVPIACASWIASKVKAKYFEHGFIVGFLIVSLGFVTANLYYRRSVALDIEAIAILIASAIFFGCDCGFFALIAGRFLQGDDVEPL